MEIADLHPWNVTPSEAVSWQERLADRVERYDRLGEIRRVAGIDVGFDRVGKEAIARAAIAVLAFPELEVRGRIVTRRKVEFPYVPGLLSFREAPVIVDALRKLDSDVDLLVADAHGLAHPRRFGLACHLGVLTDRPTLGVAKSLLVGEHDPLPEERGGWRPVVHRDETVGAAVRTRTGVRPVFVSLGHRIGLDTAIGLTLDLAPRYRLPETTREAHRLASESGDDAPR